MKHGDELVCSFSPCRDDGVKFRYCSVCSVPVAKRNFRMRHHHSTMENSQNSTRQESRFKTTSTTRIEQSFNNFQCAGETGANASEARSAQHVLSNGQVSDSELHTILEEIGRKKILDSISADLIRLLVQAIGDSRKGKTAGGSVKHPTHGKAVSSIEPCQMDAQQQLLSFIATLAPPLFQSSRLDETGQGLDHCDDIGPNLLPLVLRRPTERWMQSDFPSHGCDGSALATMPEISLRSIIQNSANRQPTQVVTKQASQSSLVLGTTEDQKPTSWLTCQSAVTAFPEVNQSDLSSFPQAKGSIATDEKSRLHAAKTAATDIYSYQSKPLPSYPSSSLLDFQRFPCKARGLPLKHNVKVRFESKFSISFGPPYENSRQSVFLIPRLLFLTFRMASSTELIWFVPIRSVAMVGLSFVSALIAVSQWPSEIFEFVTIILIHPLQSQKLHRLLATR